MEGGEEWREERGVERGREEGGSGEGEEGGGTMKHFYLKFSSSVL